MRRRLLSILLTLALAVSLFAGLGLTAEAVSANYTLYFSESRTYALKGRFDPVTATCSGSERVSGVPGYSWNAGTRTLTLDALNFSTSARCGVFLPAGSTIVLDSNNSHITGTSTGSTESYGIICAGDLTIRGHGALDAFAGDVEDTADDMGSAGIRADGTLRVSGGDVYADGGSVTGGRGLSAISLGVMADNVAVDGGSLNASGGMATASGDVIALSVGVYSKGDVTVSGGHVNAHGFPASSIEGDAQSEGFVSELGALNITGGLVEAWGDTADASEDIRGISIGITGFKTMSVSGGVTVAYGGDWGVFLTDGGGYGAVTGGLLVANGAYHAIYSKGPLTVGGTGAGVDADWIRSGAYGRGTNGDTACYIQSTGSDVRVLAPGFMPFTDVTADDWCYDNVKSAYQMGLIDGLTYTEYVPKGSLTYAQAIKLACCMNMVYNGGDPTAYFTGSSDPWYREYITYAKSNGIPWDFEDYNAPISRAEYVYIFYNSLPASSFKTLNAIADGSIPDVAANHRYAEEIYAFYRAGILDGNDVYGTFTPDAGITREQVAAILSRMMTPELRKTGTVFEQNWKEPYRALLSAGGYYCYSIYDVDKDGVPELFIKRGTCEADFMTKVYTCKAGVCSYTGEFGSGHSSLASCPGGNGVVLSWGHMGCAEMIVLRIVGGEITEGECIFTEDISADPDAGYTEVGEIVPGALYLDEYTDLAPLT